VVAAASAPERSTVASQIEPFPQGLFAGMLTHSPPLPLVIEYIAIGDPDEITTEDEAIILAPEQRNRIHHVCLRMPVLKLQKPLIANEGKYAQTREGAAMIARRA